MQLVAGKPYLKACLECWATGEDEVRIKAVVALRGDEGGREFGV